MSIFRTVSANCPSCATPVDFELVYSVAADRRPDLREAILDGSFQRQPCTACNTMFRAEPEFSYVDLSLRLYIGAWPVEQRRQWRECAQRTQATFDDSFGANATREAREVGQGMRARAVFGWAALAEKIRAAQAGIDDATLEVGKAIVMRSLPDMPVPGAQQLRLLYLDGDDPVMGWVRSADGSAHGAQRVPRKLFAQIESEPERWQALRETVSEGPVVDVQRDMLPD